MFPSDTMVEFIALEELEINADLPMFLPEQKPWEVLLEKANEALSARDYYAVRRLLGDLAFMIPKIEFESYERGLKDDLSDLPF